MATPTANTDASTFWASLDKLVSESTITIGRPGGTAHPRYPTFIYPLDYGYLQGTKAKDGNEVDIWRGSLPSPAVTAVVCTVDLLKRDTEVKLLLGCTSQEATVILATHNSGPQSAVLIERPQGA
jgi:inorganic pyrophosphatase